MGLNTFNKAAELNKELTLREKTLEDLERAASYGTASNTPTCINFFHKVHDQQVTMPRTVLELMLTEGINRVKCEIVQIKLAIARL